MESVITKTPQEIQRAHDLLLSVILGDVKVHRLDEDQMLDAMAYASVLCWLLGHTHNPVFEKNMALLEGRLRRAAAAGRRLIRRPEETIQ